MARKRGRKRRIVERQPNGQPRRSEPAMRDDVQAVVVEARMRHFGVPRDVARKDLAGYAAGRMYLRGVIDREELEALERYGALRSAYLVSLAGPKGAASVAFERVAPMTGDIPPDARDAELMGRWLQVSDALSAAHARAHRAVAEVAHCDVEQDMTDGLRCGLEALVDLWGLRQRPASGIGRN